MPTAGCSPWMPTAPTSSCCRRRPSRSPTRARLPASSHTPEGKLAKSFAESIVPVGKVIKLVLNGREKFGRQLGNAQLPDGKMFSDAMLEAEHAKSYDGGKR